MNGSMVIVANSPSVTVTGTSAAKSPSIAAIAPTPENPAVKSPSACIVPMPLRADHSGAMGIELPCESNPAAVNCCRCPATS